MVNEVVMSSASAASYLYELSSAESAISLLDEKEISCKELGLQQLNKLVNLFWPEIVDSLPVLESIYEDKSFEARKLAALVISKVYYHLEEYPQALQYALAAGDHFDVSERSEYTNIILANAVDEYIKAHQEIADNIDIQAAPSDNGAFGLLKVLVERMISMSVLAGDEIHAMGIVLDSRRVDLMMQILEGSKDRNRLINYVMCSVNGVLNKAFQDVVYTKIRDVILNSHAEILMQHYTNLCVCFYQLDDYEAMAMLLYNLIISGEHLKAFQIAYDIVDVGDQRFLKLVQESPIFAPLDSSLLLGRLKYILSGTSTIELYLQFLHRKNHTDLKLLEQLMNTVDQRNSITHNAIVISHSLMQAGTCCDTFLRDNLSWLSKANNWSKFTATASIGVVHKGYINQSKKVLSSYLPANTNGASYSEGGSLYALGLIHVNHYEASTKELLLSSLRNESVEEALHHGAALGLGLVCMGQCDLELYEELKSMMFRNNAVPGQAAAIAIGLLMIGSGTDSVIEELYTFSHETQHEKIIRACVVAIGMVLYRMENEADETITKLCSDDDSIIRYGGMFCYAMAYCGTASCKAINDLLSAAVSDVSDDVRRAAVISLGFVLCNTPSELPKVLKLLAVSYNPHVRYGVTIALGICCAATASPDALKLLQKLATDRSDFVRQGAFMALGLVLQQSNFESNPDVKGVRENFLQVAGDKHQDIMARFGAIIGLGLMNAGGQNCVASLYTCRGNMRREAVVGFCMFAQLWYWHSFILFISLTFQPTCLIGLTEELKVPIGYKIVCSAPPKLFDYIPHVTDAVVQTKKDEVTAVLSISTKRNSWLSHKKSIKQLGVVEDRADKQRTLDDVSSVLSDGKSVKAEVSSIAATMGQSSRASCADSVDNRDVAMASDSGDGIKLDSFVDPLVRLENPCRVLPKQATYCTFPKDSRYTPVFSDRIYGITMIVDHTPNEHEDYLLFDCNEPEAPPFIPFEWDG